MTTLRWAKSYLLRLPQRRFRELHNAFAGVDPERRQTPWHYVVKIEDPDEAPSAG